MIELIEIEPGRLDAGAAGFLQTAFWGSFKAKTAGWKGLSYSFAGSYGDGLVSVLTKELRGGKSLAYVPHGPELDPGVDTREAFLAELAQALLAKLPRNTLCVRFDPPWYVEGVDAKFPALRAPIKKAPADVQPPDTVLVDIRGSEEEILAAMKPKWRYNVKLAEKKGVKVFQADSSELAKWYDIYRVTSERDKIALHPLEYYQGLFELAKSYAPGEFGGGLDARLWLASLDGELLAGNITVFHGTQAVYLYGASTNAHRDLMPTYALQWEAIKAARKAGCESYDLFGIPPNDDPHHPMHGLYRFKTGFGGKVIHRAGAWDYPNSRVAYLSFGIAEKLRTFWFKRVRKIFKKR